MIKRYQRRSVPLTDRHASHLVCPMRAEDIGGVITGGGKPTQNNRVGADQVKGTW